MLRDDRRVCEQTGRTMAEVSAHTSSASSLYPLKTGVQRDSSARFDIRMEYFTANIWPFCHADSIEHSYYDYMLSISVDIHIIYIYAYTHTYMYLCM